MKNVLILLVVLGGLQLSPSSIPAQELLGLQLEFGTLPGQQGWSFGTDETVYCSVDGTRLLIDTMGVPYSDGVGRMYAYDVSAFSTADYWSLNIRARVLASESYAYPDGFYNPWGFMVGVGYGGLAGGFALTPDMLVTYSPQQTVIPLDGNIWHEYQVVGDRGAQTFSIYIDGEHLITEAMNTYPAGYNQAFFGDGTSGGNARAEISYLDLTLQNYVPVATESTSWGRLKSLYR
jgi:hypothetical protein